MDAALDLSHTQNVGNMIRTHFPYSQFIVVSLKEGMFSNANVLFRTKFVDGVSTVTRTVTSNARYVLDVDAGSLPGLLAGCSSCYAAACPGCAAAPVEGRQAECALKVLQQKDQGPAATQEWIRSLAVALAISVTVPFAAAGLTHACIR